MRRVTSFRSVALSGMLMAVVCSASAAAQTPGATLPSQCLDQQVAPPSVTLTCADGGFIAHDLVWSDWGAAQAHALGTASVNTCEPDCAHGESKDYAVELVADRLLSCSFGKPQYTIVTYRFPNGVRSRRQTTRRCPSRVRSAPTRTPGSTR
jgi:hypothetical protein